MQKKSKSFEIKMSGFKIVSIFMVILSLFLTGCRNSLTSIVDTIPPGPVLELTATAGDGQISLSWTNPTDSDFDHVELWSGTGGLTDTRYNETIIPAGTVISSLSNGSTYTLLVKSIDTNGNISTGVSTTATPVDSTSPSEVSNLTATAGDGQITVSWTNPTDSDFDHVELWSGTGGIPDTGYNDTITSSGTVISSLSNGTTYSLLVKSIDTNGNTSTGVSTTATPVDPSLGPDLIAGDRIYLGTDNWNDASIATSGDIHKVYWYFENIGNSAAYNADHHIRIFLSEDKVITEADSLILDFPYPLNCPIGELYGGKEEFTVPFVEPGVYYIGCIIDVTEVIDELNESNNVTLPEDVAEFTIKDSSTISTGAFKFVNSWGDWSTTWENIPDGHYWVTYETMKKQEMMIRYYYNSFSPSYEPTVIAVFKLSHDYRNKCKVIIGLGDPENPYMKKELQSRWVDDIKTGDLPFPSNNIVIDISEFADAINDYDLFLQVENSSVYEGTIDNYSVEFYSDYDNDPFKIVVGNTNIIPTNESVTVTANTTSCLNYVEIEQIVPQSRIRMLDTKFVEESPGVLELDRDIQSAGVYQPWKNYNEIVYGGFRTGAQPPSEFEWASMKKLRGIESFLDRGTLPELVDHSTTQYFPPIGSQGSEGSCTCFSFGYYIQTFTEAKEHGWDLSGASWIGGYNGAPDLAYQDKIFSPDFIYHQINSGVDEGSSGTIAASFIIRIGGATWEKMPYDTSDSTSWPSEEAWREAGRYRGQEVGNHYWDFVQSGYFIVYEDSDINLLKSLLAQGYCVSASINASEGGLYDLLDQNDVADNYTAAKMSTNHAQTIVGYKEGESWDPANP